MMARTKILTALAFLLSVQFCMALHVTPISVELVSFDLDSLRLQCETTQEYITQLEILQGRVRTDKERLYAVSEQIKLENQRYKSEIKLLKEKEKQLNAQENVYKSELKLHKADQKAIDKERKTLLKNETLDPRSQQLQLQDLSRRESRLTQDINTCNKKILELKTQRETLKNELIDLAEFNYEIQTKTSALKQLENTNVYQSESLKNQIAVEKKALKTTAKQ